MDGWATILAACSAFFAAVACIANFFQVRRAAQANEVNVYIEMQKDYTTEEMRTAISELASFWRENIREYPSITAAYEDKKKRHSEKVRELRGHCRMLSAYFVNAARLYETGLISKKLLKAMILHPGLNVFYEVAVPINRSTNSNHNSIEYSNILREIVPRHGAGIY